MDFGEGLPLLCGNCGRVAPAFREGRAFVARSLGEPMKFHRWSAFAAVTLAVSLAGSAQAATHHYYGHKHYGHGRHVAGRASSWDGRWAGAWGGNDPTAINIHGGRVVSYEYGGATTPVHSSRVSAKRISYGEKDVSVTVTRTGPNTAHATIKTSQGNGEADLTRQ